MLKELLRGLRWVFVALGTIAFLVALWVGCAWSIGWALNHFYDLKNFGSSQYISVGSCALVFTVLIQIVTIILTLWVILSYGKNKGLIKTKSKS